MGNALGSPTPGDVRLVMVGLDGSGKTSILYKLKNGQIGDKPQTKGFHNEVIEYKKHNRVSIWDLAGKVDQRHLWKYYFHNTQALVFVVDSSSKERFQEVISELKGLLGNQELKETPMLLYLNKKDLTQPEPFPASQLESLMNNDGRKFNMLRCSALTGDGLKEGLEWLFKTIK